MTSDELTGSARVLRVGVVHGPNLSRLGTRDPEVYGSTSLAELDDLMQTVAEHLDIELSTIQSNHEGELIDWLEARESSLDAVICNPAGLTSYGVSLRDCLDEVDARVAIVHISNIYRREGWRSRDIFAEIADLYIAGAGTRSYLLALRGLANATGTLDGGAARSI